MVMANYPTRSPTTRAFLPEDKPSIILLEFPRLVLPQLLQEQALLSFLQ